MIHRFLCSLLALYMTSALPGPAQALKVGDPVPPLRTGKFLKGKPVTTFKKGTAYVVAFLTPADTKGHLSEQLTLFQKQYPDLVFLGILVTDREEKVAKAYVNRLGARAGFPIALDTAKEKKFPLSIDFLSASFEGEMARTWLTPGEQETSPDDMWPLYSGAVFLVDQAGKVAWKGDLGGVINTGPLLGLLEGGQLEPETVLRLREFRRSFTEKQIISYKWAEEAYLAGGKEDFTRALQLWNEGLAAHPGMERYYGQEKVRILFHLGRGQEALDYMNHLLRNVLTQRSQAESLSWLGNQGSHFYWLQGVPELKPEFAERLDTLTTEALNRAHGWSEGKNSQIEMARAERMFREGNIGEALRVARRALSLAETGAYDTVPLLTRLKEMEKARSEIRRLKVDPKRYVLRGEELTRAIGMANKNKDWNALVSLSDEVERSYPNDANLFYYRLLKVKALIGLKKEKEALTHATRLRDDSLKKDDPATWLNSLVGSIVEPGAPPAGPELLAFEIETMAQAEKLLPRRNPQFVDTLARVYFVQGDVAKAVETQREAVRLNKELGGIFGSTWLEDHLKEYEAAINKKE